MVRITEKPDWVSWDDVAEVVHQAHAENRAKGIVMRYGGLSGDEIRQRIEGKGTMLVALDGEQVVGTYAVKTKKLPDEWYGHGEVAYGCFGSMLPSYHGHGVYRMICSRGEEIAKEMGMSRIMYDTHAANRRQIELTQKAGYKLIKYRWNYGHMSVIAIKWFDGCPYADWKLSVMFHLSKVYASLVRMKHKVTNHN